MKLGRITLVALAGLGLGGCLSDSDEGAQADAVTTADGADATTSSDGTSTATSDDDAATSDDASADTGTPVEDTTTVADTTTPVEDTSVPVEDTSVPVEDTTVTPDVEDLPTFSFFVTSLKALQDLSGDQNGFGGDLRYGEEGLGAGLRGADLLCSIIAERSMPGAGKKTWRAFLSANEGEDGNVVNAIDRIGEGPWYDRLGRTFALTKADVLHDRPTSADAAIKNDFPNEDGVPNHRPDPTKPAVDNHDTLTGSNDQGKRYSSTSNCNSWTGNAGTEGKPRVGHSWPRNGPGGGGMGGNNPANWMSALSESGCAPGVNLIETGPPDDDSDTVGSGGGYGGWYCFALEP